MTSRMSGYPFKYKAGPALWPESRLGGGAQQEGDAVMFTQFVIILRIGLRNSGGRS